ncbi:uncharacterized protein [Palaemon carinicauda]|uniref:uncharacterized protein n=1 Tax=Palaemon carinicauda TaxID=392227 RepID=UPI0035B5CD32
MMHDDHLLGEVSPNGRDCTQGGVCENGDRKSGENGACDGLGDHGGPGSSKTAAMRSPVSLTPSRLALKEALAASKVKLRPPGAYFYKKSADNAPHFVPNLANLGGLVECNKEPEPPLLETNVNTDSIATGTSSMKCSEPKSFFDLSDDDGLVIPSSDEEDPEEDRVELHKEDQIEYIPSKYKNMNLRLRVKKKYSKPKSHFPLDDDDDSFMSSSDEDDGDEYTPPSYRKGKKGSQRNKIFERDSNISNPYLWPINIWEYY